LKTVAILFAVLLGLALILSNFAGQPILFVPIVLNFVLWTVLGFLLTTLALAKGVWEFCSRAAIRRPRNSDPATTSRVGNRHELHNETENR
jgi:hypothetical protein